MGESFVVDGIAVEVLEVDGFAIQRICLRVDPEALAADDAAGDDDVRSGDDPPGAEATSGQPMASPGEGSS